MTRCLRKSIENEAELPNNEQQMKDMDDVLARIGGAGRFNVFTLLVMILTFAFTVAISLSPVFTTLQLTANCSGSDNSSASIAAVFVETAASRFGLECDWAFLASLPTTCYFLGFFVGCIVYGGLADRIGRQQQLLCAGLCCLVFSLSLCLLSESPRWLASVGRFGEADRALTRIDRLNNGRGGLRLPPNFSTEALVAKERGNVTKSGMKDSFRRLMREPSLRRRTFFSWFLFFAVSITYFGVALGVGRLGGDVFINQLASAAVEPPSRLVCALISLKLGRRSTICGSISLAGLCLLAVAVLSNFSDLTVWRVGVAVAGKFWINMTLDLTFLYATEVFPTDLRSVGVGIGSSMSRAGALLSTLVPSLGILWRPLPFLVFACFPLIAATTAPFLMIETGVQQLPDALQVELEMEKSMPLILKLTNGHNGLVFEQADRIAGSEKVAGSI